MRSADQAGYVTPAFVGVVGLTMLLLVMVANLYVSHYARGVMQAAVEEGARQGLAVGDPAACHERVDAVVRSGLGSMAAQVGPATCVLLSERSTASVNAVFTPWLPGVPTQRVSVRAGVASGNAER